MILDLFLAYIAYKVGYIFIKFLTFGKYPKVYVTGGTIGIESVGILVLVAILVIAFYFIY